MADQFMMRDGKITKVVPTPSPQIQSSPVTSNPPPPGTFQNGLGAPSLPTIIETPPSQPTEQSLLPGVNVMLMGPTGTGKTYIIGTLVDTGIEVFLLGLESGMEALIGYYKDQGKPVPSNLHWHTMQLQTPGGYGKLAENAAIIGQSTYEAVCKIQDFSRSQNNQFEKLLRVMNKPVCQDCGKEFPPVDRWGPDRAIVIDGFTGVCNFAMAAVVGMKPVRSKPDYGTSQPMVEGFIRYTCDGAKCHFVLLAHIERETDEVMGGSKVTVSALGQKLAPKIPPMFSDVILAVRQGKTWHWNTADPFTDLKTRNLPIEEKIEPGFGQIIQKWMSRGGRLLPTVKSAG